MKIELPFTLRARSFFLWCFDWMIGVVGGGEKQDPPVLGPPRL